MASKRTESPRVRHLIPLAYSLFIQNDCTTRAAAIAYYMLLSFFPLLLFLVALASPFLSFDALRQRIVAIATSYLPSATPLIEQNLESAMRQRGTVNLIAAIGFLWSSSSVFGVMHRSFNAIWDTRDARPFWKQKLVAIAAVGLIVLLFFLSLAVTSLVRLIEASPLAGAALLADGELKERLSIVLLVLSNMILFAALYRLLPDVPPTWRSVLPAAILAGGVWELAKRAFVAYLGTFARYNLVYGSLGLVIAFMVWSYLTGLIILGGACLSAAWGAVFAPRSDRVARHP